VEALSREVRGRHAEEDASEAFAALLAGASDQESLIGLARMSFAQIVDNERQHRLELAVTIAMLRLEAQHARTGAYPHSLDAMGVPNDPITGEAFVYRLTPADPDGLSFSLYSTGWDRQDNGGIEKPAAGLTAPGPDDAGFDVVFTKPRRDHQR
jgi:hypothetical protein